MRLESCELFKAFMVETDEMLSFFYLTEEDMHNFHNEMATQYANFSADYDAQFYGEA